MASYYNGTVTCAIAFLLAVSLQLTASPQAGLRDPLSQAQAELERIERAVAEGGLPRAKLEEARQMVAEAEDQAVLQQTLYATRALEELNEQLTQRMLESARRLMERQQERVERVKRLIDEGALARNALTPLVEELDRRRKALDRAESQARLWNQLAEMARAEKQRQEQMEAEQTAGLVRAKAEPDLGILSAARVRMLEGEFETVFRRPLPVSARGDTGFHRALGFDHTGRIDVAVSPDSPEGRWLRRWLERAGIPFIAFQGAVKGKSTAAHIHIGPPSLRLNGTD